MKHCNWKINFFGINWFIISAIPTDGRRQAYAEAQAKAKAEEEAIRTADKAREDAETAKKQEVEAAKAKRLSEKAAQASSSSSSSVAEESQNQESEQIAFFNTFLNKAKDFSSEQSQKLKKLSEKEAQAPTKAKAKAKADEAPEKADESAGNVVNNFFSRAKGFGSSQPWGKLAFQGPKPSSDESNVQIATVRGQAKARALPAKKASVRQTQNNSKPKAAAKEEAKKAEVRKVFGGLFKQETIYVDDD